MFLAATGAAAFGEMAVLLMEADELVALVAALLLDAAEATDGLAAVAVEACDDGAGVAWDGVDEAVF
jgi:hypothetical protein